MTAQEKLVEFMQKKHALMIKSAPDGHLDTVLDYLYVEDLEDLMGFSDEEVEKFFNDIGKEDAVISDVLVCPFCSKYLMECIICTYGARHGMCLDPDSSYDNLSPAGGVVGMIEESGNRKELLKLLEEYTK